MNSLQSSNISEPLPDHVGTEQGAASQPGRRRDGSPYAPDLDGVIAEAAAALRARQADDGHWVFELEADATIPAEYILLEHFLGDIDTPRQSRIAAFLRRGQGADGGWPLFFGGETDVSATVKAYYALKLAGDSPDEPHMRRAREAVLGRGGASRSNVFTRITLALYGQMPWRAVPVMPVEIMLLPRWFPFHLDKISYWSRTVLVPLLILLDLRPRAENPDRVDIDELFTERRFGARGRMRNSTGSLLGFLFLGFDRLLRFARPLSSRRLRQQAVDRALDFMAERLNGTEGLGGIFPAMANAVMAYSALGLPRNHPDYLRARRAMDTLLTERANGETYVQPCLSPVWDTALAMHALIEAGEAGPALHDAAGWLEDRQILDVAGDWRATRPCLRPGGWAFEYDNDHYPDTDDSAVVLMALERAGVGPAELSVRRGIEWILGMQSRSGGWGSFDADNTHAYLNHIPFADHGALLDPPTVDVTARCVGMLAQCGYGITHPAVARGVDFILSEQEADGSWFGRWGTNYIYGTWSALAALNAVGFDHQAPAIRRAVDWFKARQREDGGWGEDCRSYWPGHDGNTANSLPTQTAWALLGLMSAGEVHSDAVARGIAYLMAAPRQDGAWTEELYNAVGFPRVFFLKYHGYSHYFPLWALARYRNLQSANATATSLGL